MEFEPSGDLETPYVFDEKIFGGAVPKNYFPAVEKGIAESCLKGPLALSLIHIYIAQPGGSIRDDNVIETCDKYGIEMSFTGIRLFHH